MLRQAFPQKGPHFCNGRRGLVSHGNIRRQLLVVLHRALRLSLPPRRLPDAESGPLRFRRVDTIAANFDLIVHTAQKFDIPVRQITRPDLLYGTFGRSALC